MTEESALNPPSYKGLVRRQLVQMIMDEVKAGKLMALIARSADFYGPDNSKSLFGEMVTVNLKKGKAASWPIDKNKIHSFTFTPDAAKATALLGNTHDAYNTTWHLPTDKSKLTGKDYIDLFSSAMKVPDKVKTVPLWMFKAIGLFVPIMRELTEMMYQYDRDYFFDSSKFDKRFNFRTTSYQEGVKIIVDHLR